MKKIIIITIPIIILIGIFLFLLKEPKVILSDNLEATLNSEVYANDYIKNIYRGKLVDNKRIDTSTLGTIKVPIEIETIYKQKRTIELEIKIVNNESPIIEAKEKITIKEGEEINLLENVKAQDKDKEELIVEVVGEYDINKPGTYNLKYVTRDSSGNKVEKKFVLEVTEKEKGDDQPIEPDKPTPEPVTPKEPDSTPTPTPTSGDQTFTTSKGFSGVTKDGVTYIDGILVVNKTYSLPSTYSPNGLTAETQAAADKMFAAAKLEGLYMWAQSGFRSYETQRSLYNNYVSYDGKANADRYSARPGHSEHQTGLAFDVCMSGYGCINSTFDNTPPANWLSANAYKYGFILRFPKGKENETGYMHESWHFRYVGEELASKLYNNGNWITLEDYFGITSVYSN